jgi:nucleoside-diphosphate-sugar epimerase
MRVHTRFLVTGAAGFVASATVRSLSRYGPVRGVVRRGSVPDATEIVFIDDLAGDTQWEALARNVDVVLHLAAHVHVPRSARATADAVFHRVNVEGTRRLAEGAAAAGVRRFVFVSSVKVHGEATPRGAFTPASPLRPLDPYGRSKAMAEEALREIEARTGLDVVVVRPPLVYGPGVRANFLGLLRAVNRGIPLPFGRVVNRRSLVYVDNLGDLLARAATDPSATGETYLVSDGAPLSTPALVRAIASSLGRQARLIDVPLGALRFTGRMLGGSAAMDRLLGSLEVDGRTALSRLGWRPPHSMEAGLAATAAWLQKGASGWPSSR